MDITKTTFNGINILVLFTLSCYLFYNKYYGFVAFAERSQLKHEPGRELFTLTLSNHRTAGGALTTSTIEQGAKRIIRKMERANGAKSVDFEIHEKDLANASLNLKDAFIVR